MPEVPELKQSCWNVVGWGKGCAWGKAEETVIDQGWSMQHEAYTAYADFSADGKIIEESLFAIQAFLGSFPPRMSRST